MCMYLSAEAVDGVLLVVIVRAQDITHSTNGLLVGVGLTCNMTIKMVLYYLSKETCNGHTTTHTAKHRSEGT